MSTFYQLLNHPVAHARVVAQDLLELEAWVGTLHDLLADRALSPMTPVLFDLREVRIYPDPHDVPLLAEMWHIVVTRQHPSAVLMNVAHLQDGPDQTEAAKAICRCCPSVQLCLTIEAAEAWCRCVTSLQSGRPTSSRGPTR